MSYNHEKEFKKGETLNAEDLNQLIEGINGSVTNISLRTDNVTLTITKNDGSSVNVILPSGSNANLSDYVKKTDTVSNTNPGPVKVQSSKGIKVDGDGQTLMLEIATKVDKSDKKYPLTGFLTDEIVKAGLTTTSLDWQDNDKAAACETIGAASKSDVNGLIGDISTMLNSILDLQEVTE